MIRTDSLRICSCLQGRLCTQPTQKAQRDEIITVTCLFSDLLPTGTTGAAAMRLVKTPSWHVQKSCL